MENRTEQLKPIILFILVIFLTIIAVTMFVHITSRMKAIENKNYNLEQQVKQIGSQSNSEQGNVTESEYLKTIEFLKSEISVHRMFIEQQRQYLIWEIGIIGTLSVALLVFLGIRKKKDVDSIIEKSYSELIERKIDKYIDSGKIETHIDEYINGNENKIFLEQAILQQRKAHENKILVLSQKNNAEECKMPKQEIENYFKDNEYEVESYEIDYEDENNERNRSRIKELIRSHTIVIYEVHSDEIENDKKYYEIIKDYCEIKSIFCILFTKKDFPRGQMPSGQYIAVSKMFMTVLERVNGYLRL